MKHSIEKQIQQAESSLQRKLGWIGRHDTRIGFVTGVAIAMLGVLAHASAQVVQWDCKLYISFGLGAILLFTTLLLIYCSQYPRTESRNYSLAFFGTIALLKVDEYKKRFKERSDEDYLDDLLCQIHINAEILSKKFYFLKISLRVLLLSVPPWLLALYLSRLYVK